MNLISLRRLRLVFPQYDLTGPDWFSFLGSSQSCDIWRIKKMLQSLWLCTNRLPPQTCSWPKRDRGAFWGHIYPTALPPSCSFASRLISHFRGGIRRILQSDVFQREYNSHSGDIVRDSFADSQCSNETSASDEKLHVSFYMRLKPN